MCDFPAYNYLLHYTIVNRNGIPHLDSQQRWELFCKAFSCLQFSSYVTQDDIFDGNEKVVECLQFSYRLRTAVPRSWGPEKRRAQEREAVQRTLNLLGLDEVQTNNVGSTTHRGISGGQKRRLTLGIGKLATF